MNIIVLTQPLTINYGGLLQAYALQTVLKRAGHTVYTEDRRRNTDQRALWRRLASKVKMALDPYANTPAKESIISQHTQRFVRDNITCTVPIYGTDKKAFKQYKPDAYIVGSDQVWRPKFSWGIYNYFLDFAINQDVKRIAYAASFGTDVWEFTSEQEKVCSELLRKFDVVSVREESAVELCYQHFGLRPSLVADPTMLLTARDYQALIVKDNTEIPSHAIMTYILNHKRRVNYAIVNDVAKLLGGIVIEGYPRYRAHEVKSSDVSKCIVKPVERWLHGIRDAKYIVTDSFHGTVFSLLFNKQFLVIDNNISGSTRLRSILRKFGLSNRLITSHEDVNAAMLSAQIDYNRINPQIEAYRQESLHYLYNALQQR